MGIHTALLLAQENPKEIRSRFSVVLERTLCELNGESCLELEEIEPAGAVGSMQGDLFAAPDNTQRQIELMKVVD